MLQLWPPIGLTRPFAILLFCVGGSKREAPSEADLTQDEATTGAASSVDSVAGTSSSMLFTLPESKRIKREDHESVSELFSFGSNVTQKQEGSPKTSKAVTLSSEQELVVINHVKDLPSAVVENNHALAQYVAKLKLRQCYRKLGISLFDLDALVRDSLRSVKCYQPHPTDPHLAVPVPVDQSDTTSPVGETVVTVAKQQLVEMPMDHFSYGPTLTSPLPPVLSSFASTISGGCYNKETFVSPYTMRILKPIIWTDYESKTKKMNVLAEIKHRYHSTSPTDRPLLDSDPSTQLPLTYCYLRPHHVPAVNSLIANFFWRGVDVRECLEYPDFTVVALYGKLAIGCGFLIPDVRVNEAYVPFLLVHPDWQGSGVGSFMLYHLIQTCMGKDVTLHVAVNNPAVFLYQKFGFKAERLCCGFYDRYYPADHCYSKHALFMRLRR